VRIAAGRDDREPHQGRPIDSGNPTLEPVHALRQVGDERSASPRKMRHTCRSPPCQPRPPVTALLPRQRGRSVLSCPVPSGRRRS